MDSMTTDPELASEMLSLLNKELKMARLRIADLECSNVTSAQVKQYKERAEAAEFSMQVLKTNFEGLSAENKLLRVALEELKDSKVVVKKENVDDSWTNIKKTDQSTSTNNDSDLENAKDLEAALVKYYGKYKTEKEARKGLSQTSRDLEEQVSLLLAENNNLQRKSKESQRGPPASNPEIKPCSPLPQVPCWKDFDDYMSYLPKYDDRPHVSQLHPVCGQGLDLKAYLASDPRTSRCATNFMYLPDLLVWCPGRESALAIGPIYLFDDDKGQWVKTSIFENLYEKAFALFYPWKGIIFYGGTYKAINFRKWNSEGCAIYGDSKGLSLNALADATVMNKKASNQLSSMKSTIRGLYADSVLKVETLGLHCVGFDRALHAKLKERHDEGSRSVVLPETYYDDSENKGRGSSVTIGRKKRQRSD